jgi:hypothetical protein
MNSPHKVGRLLIIDVNSHIAYLLDETWLVGFINDSKKVQN